MFVGDRYKPTDIQKEFHRRCLEYPIVLFIGATGSGKTTALIWQLIDDCLMVRNNRGVLARMAYEDLERTVLEDLLFELEMSGIPYQHYSRKKQIFFPATGSVVFLTGLGDTVKSLRRTKGLNVGFIAIDQVEDVPFEVFKFQLTRLRLPHVPRNRRHLFATANPVPETHWLYEFFVGIPEWDIEKAQGTAVVYATIDDNPYLPSDFKNILLDTMSPEEVERYAKGEWGFVPEGSAVFRPFFQKPVHVRELEFDPRYALLVGLDFGYHRPAAVWVQVVGEPENPSGRCVHVLDEFLGHNMLLDDFIEIVKNRTGAYFTNAPIVIYCGDPYAAVQKSDRAESIDVELRVKHKIALRMKRVPIEAGIQNIIGLLRKNRLFIHPKCKILVRAFEGGYRRDEVGEILKDGYYDHIVDALRYVLDIYAPFGQIHPPVNVVRAVKARNILGTLRIY
ncbi:MAG: phage terminase large subunit [Armatimonadota bacterium]|nr:phage terminase large subunit [Armatimonadota bacterium]MDW8142664.1 phage terminase large subunit [Armatimonadota bacterium]